MSDMYVAERFPSAYSVFRMLFDPQTCRADTTADYVALSERVQASVKEALVVMDVRIG